MVGLIEGVGEATAAVRKLFSGWLSDKIGKRKVLTVIGYGLAALSKPLFALASRPTLVLAARFADRVGKGVRDAPRDALISDIVAQGQLSGAGRDRKDLFDKSHRLGSQKTANADWVVEPFIYFEAGFLKFVRTFQQDIVWCNRPWLHRCGTGDIPTRTVPALSIRTARLRHGPGNICRSYDWGGLVFDPDGRGPIYFRQAVTCGSERGLRSRLPSLPLR